MLNKLGVGSLGGVIIILTRGVGKWLTYGIPARYRVVLVEHLGGLLFDDRHSCAGDSSLVIRVCTAASPSWCVYLFVCETQLAGFK